MNIELSITVWPIVSLLLWLFVWAATTCIGCLYMAVAWEEAKERDWRGLTLTVCMLLFMWFMQWGSGLYLNEWLKIVLGN